MVEPHRAQAVSTDLLADDVFFIALDDRTGQMRVHADVIGPALAGALLAEVAAGGWIEVDRGLLKPATDIRRRQTVPNDALSHLVLDTILGQKELLPVQQWITYLAGSAEREVAERLGRANRIKVERHRWVLGRSTIYRPADTNNAAWPRARLSEHCRNRRHLADNDVVLVGLCHAAGLLYEVLDAAPAGTYRFALEQVGTRLADRACVLAVLGALESTVTADASQLA